MKRLMSQFIIGMAVGILAFALLKDLFVLAGTVAGLAALYLLYKKNFQSSSR